MPRRVARSSHLPYFLLRGSFRGFQPPSLFIRGSMPSPGHLKNPRNKAERQIRFVDDYFRAVF